MSKGKIYTRTGDKGQTSLFDGTRVNKHDIHMECLGEIDTLNSMIGMLRVTLDKDHSWQKELQLIQTELMDSMSFIATPASSPKPTYAKLPEETSTRLEKWMDELEDTLKTPTNSFILPGGNSISAWCHLARTQTRTAERRLIALNEQEPVETCILKFINRLSDLFFKLSRAALDFDNSDEERWKLFQGKSK